MSKLNAVIIIDYQNLHITAANLFAPHDPIHEQLINPLAYAKRLLSSRHSSQKEQASDVELRRVIVFRGLPSASHDPKPYARNQAQKANWERDSRVTVHHRPLKYVFERLQDGRKATDEFGKALIKDKQEKGVDVLCALAVIQEAMKPENDIVILCSQDSDLEPALDAALELRSAKIETACWYEPNSYWSKEIRPAHGRRIWNTRMDRRAFQASLDQNLYL